MLSTFSFRQITTTFDKIQNHFKKRHTQRQHDSTLQRRKNIAQSRAGRYNAVRSHSKRSPRRPPHSTAAAQSVRPDCKIAPDAPPTSQGSQKACRPRHGELSHPTASAGRTWTARQLFELAQNKQLSWAIHLAPYNPRALQKHQ